MSMPVLSDVIPGTFFLVAPVLVLVFFNLVPWTTVVAIIAALAIPLGWVSFSFEGFYLTWKGRYEDTLPYRHIRDRIDVDNYSGEIVVNLEKVLPEEFGVRKIGFSSQTEYELLFDPFKKLVEPRFWLFEKIFGTPFRKKQPKIYREIYKGKTKPFYVENVEDITFFFNAALADYVRGSTGHWHTLRASFYGFLWGITSAVGLALFSLSSFFGETPLFLVIFLEILGFVICVIPIAILCWISYEYSRLRRSESMAHEHLMIRLKIR